MLALYPQEGIYPGTLGKGCGIKRLLFAFVPALIAWAFEKADAFTRTL